MSPSPNHPRRHSSDAASRARNRRIWPPVFAIAILYVGSTLLTPLYPIYQREFHFTELVVTEIYAVYVIGNLTVLFAFGRLSDQLGRRSTALIALGATLASALAFLVASSTTWLFIARVLNGFGAGLGAGALTAWIAELEPEHDNVRAAALTSAGNLGGLAFGAVVAGVLAEHGPSPLRWTFALYLTLLIAIIAVLVRSRETVEIRAKSVAALSLEPRIGVPPRIRLAFVSPAAMAFSAFSLGGFYAALAPGVLVEALQQDDLMIIGAVVGCFFGAACFTAMATRALGSKASMVIGSGLMLVGLPLLMLAEHLGSMRLFVAATVVAGAAMALAYRSSLQIVNQIAPADQKAEVLSTYLLVCYTANAMPVLGIGLLGTIVSSEFAHATFAAVLVVLAVIACIVGLRYGDRTRETDGTPRRSGSP
jgi:MFS family permease